MNYMISELFPGRNFCDVDRGRERRERTKKITEPQITLFPFKWTENLQESASDEARGIRWVATPRPWAYASIQWEPKVGGADKHDRRRHCLLRLLQRQIWRKHRLLYSYSPIKISSSSKLAMWLVYFIAFDLSVRKNNILRFSVNFHCVTSSQQIISSSSQTVGNVDYIECLKRNYHYLAREFCDRKSCRNRTTFTKQHLALKRRFLLSEIRCTIPVHPLSPTPFPNRSRMTNCWACFEFWPLESARKLSRARSRVLAFFCLFATR